MRSKAFYALLLSTTLVQAKPDTSFEEITIEAFPLSNQISSSLHSSSPTSSDSADILKSMPGANANGNGPITGIAQYRGMYGDRISVKIDQAPTLTGGPNAMDTPLSYAPSGLLNELIVYRGIAPVSASQESIGGHMVAKLNRGKFSDNSSFNSHGFANIQLNDNANQSNADIQLITANNTHKLSFLASHNEGDNFSAGNNQTVEGTQYQRDRFDIAYGWKSSLNELTIFAGQQDIANSGTPALAMDIININTDMAGLNLIHQPNSNTIDQINMAVSWADVDHGMDNHSLRKKPAMTMKYRHNQANAENLAWSIDAQLPVTFGELKLGTDGNLQSHNSVITNPENAMFKVQNFTDSERDNLGVFAEFNGNVNQWNYQLGIRHNRIELNSGNVSAAGMMDGGMDMSGMDGGMDMSGMDGDMSTMNDDMGGMNDDMGGMNDDMGGMNDGMGGMNDDMGGMNDPMSDMDNQPCQGMQSCATALSDAFNQSQRSINFNTNDLVIKLSRALDRQTALNIDMGIKQRAPSYRETFLWLPLPITGGLADGRNYTGNLSLKPETSREITLGLSKNTDNFSIQPQIFYRNIDNYIQGVPSENAIANKFSNDMSNSDALVYSNTDAEIYGLDTNWQYTINNQWAADGTLSYVRGKRKDTVDNLYRIAPANGRFSLHYQPQQGTTYTLESFFYARQKQVASYADESQTNGYEIVNLSAIWKLNEQLQVRSGITNLFDRYYANHLNSVNRVADSDIAVGDVIPGTGRTAYISTKFKF
jgi:iron complex outermembrane receptor protein